MNRLCIILLIFLSSCSGVENYKEATNDYLDRISTDSLIQESRKNITQMISKTKHEHEYADSVSGCLDSIKHVLELKEMELNEVHQYERIEVAETYDTYELEELEMVDRMVMSEELPYIPDTIFIHDTIYVDTSATIKDLIIELELMTEKEKAKLKKKRSKNKNKHPKFRK